MGLIIISIIAGCAAGAIIYLILFKIEGGRIPNLSDKFNFSKNKAINGLVEKKQYQIKEINDEVEAERAKLMSMLEDRKRQVQYQTDAINDSFKEKQAEFQNKCNQLDAYYKDKRAELETLEKKWRDQSIDNTYKEIKELELQHNAEIEKKKVEYDRVKKGMTEDFLAYSAAIDLKRENLTKEIQEFEEKQKAIIERFKKDEEARQQADFYHISIDSAAQRDISQLIELTKHFSKPNAIYKLVWDMYYKAPIEALFKKILNENSESGGIYKITNIENQKVYIGRTTKFKDRWRTHAKRGCGIDKINGLLYDEMMKVGLDKFTWEIVEVCDKELQSEREKYWIKFYHSDEWGYNQNKGG